MPVHRRLLTLAQARSLRPQDVATLLQISGLLGGFMVLQRVLPLPSLIRFFDARPRARSVGKARADRVIKLTNALLQCIYGRDFCLQRSLVLFHFFRKWGYPVRIHFGITRKEGKLTGHAWLDEHGTPFAEHDDPALVYRTIYVYPR